MHPKVKQITDEVGKYLSKPYNQFDGNEVSTKLTDAVVCLGKLAWAMAQAEKECAVRIGELAEKHGSENATKAKMLISAEMADDEYYLNLAKAQDKQVHYTIEALRTQISYIKNEMNNL